MSPSSFKFSARSVQSIRELDVNSEEPTGSTAQWDHSQIKCLYHVLKQSLCPVTFCKPAGECVLVLHSVVDERLETLFSSDWLNDFRIFDAGLLNRSRRRIC